MLLIFFLFLLSIRINIQRNGIIQNVRMQNEHWESVDFDSIHEERNKKITKKWKWIQHLLFLPFLFVCVNQFHLHLFQSYHSIDFFGFFFLRFFIQFIHFVVVLDLIVECNCFNLNNATTEASNEMISSSTEVPTTRIPCERQCPYYYYPICASNGIENRMFVNPCEMFAFNCDTKQSELNKSLIWIKFLLKIIIFFLRISKNQKHKL